MTTSDKLREIADRHLRSELNTERLTPLQWEGIMRTIENVISEHYVSKEEHEKLATATNGLLLTNKELRAKYDEAVRQRDELREALIDMVWQFAYEGTKNGEGVMYAGGLSALEGAFSALGLSDPITVLDFEAAIKNTDG